MRKTKEEAAITRDTLLKAALTIFSRKGYASATLGNIAEEAGVTRGAIYWHFGSKAELYIALLQEYNSLGGQIMQKAVEEGGSLLDILRRIFVNQMMAVETNSSLRAMMELTLFRAERVPELDEIRQQQTESSLALVANIAAALQQGIAAGELRSDMDAEEMARAFLAYQNGLIYLWLQDTNAFSLKDNAPALIDMYLEGIIRKE